MQLTNISAMQTYGGSGNNRNSKSSGQSYINSVGFQTQFVTALLNAQQDFHQVAPSYGPDGKPVLAQHISGWMAAPGTPSATSASELVSSTNSGVNTGSLNLNGLKATDVANALIHSFGSGGTLSLSDIEKFMDVNTAANNSGSPRQVIENDWYKLTHGTNNLSKASLTAAIQHYLDSAKTS